MKFVNLGKAKKIRIGNLVSCYWKTLNKNETIDIPRDIGLSYGLIEVKTTKGQINNKTVKTKQLEIPFLEELKKIEGIGNKTAKDITVWGNKEKLIKAVKNKEDLPFRNDIEDKLRERYG